MFPPTNAACDACPSSPTSSNETLKPVKSDMLSLLLSAAIYLSARGRTEAGDLALFLRSKGVYRTSIHQVIDGRYPPFWEDLRKNHIDIFVFFNIFQTLLGLSSRGKLERSSFPRPAACPAGRRWTALRRRS